LFPVFIITLKNIPFMKKYLTAALFAFVLFTGSLHAQLTATQIDSLAERTLRAFNVPGIAVAVVKDGKVIHAKGYGVRSLKTMQKVG
jgi:CubicO group peptidase (beta-lactamase class C family)